MTRARALLPCLLLALAAPRQEPVAVEEPSVAEEIAALIESTNALESFHCVWLGEEEDQRLELAYAAPDKGRVTLLDDGKEKGKRFDEENVYFLDEDGDWRSCELPRSEARARLDELFPSPQRLGPGFEFFVGGQIGLSCDANFRPQGRDALLGWLAWMEKEPENVARESDVLVWTISNCELRVARDSGFPRQITLRAPERTVALRLVECTTDEPVEVTPPEDVEPGAEDEDQCLLVWTSSLPPIVRGDAFERVEALLASGARKWDTSTEADWDEFLVVLHSQDIQWALVEWVKELLDYINQALVLVRAALEQSDTPEARAKLAEYLDELEEGLAPGFEEAPANYLASLEQVEDVREELIEAEREAVLRLHDELVTQPILAYLAEGRQAILGE